MHSKLSLILALIVSFAIVSCKSNEEKANALIKNELSKSYNDFDSYDPIETVVTEAYQTPYNDSTCVDMAEYMAYQLMLVNEALDAVQEAKERAEIWGVPTAYSSTYSDQQFFKYKREIDENMEKCRSGLSAINIIGMAMQDSISIMDSSKIVGWEVKHRFRCKTRGGLSTIADYRYVVSKDFKNILIQQDTDDKEYKTVCAMISDALKGKYKLDEESVEDI